MTSFSVIIDLIGLSKIWGFRDEAVDEEFESDEVFMIGDRTKPDFRLSIDASLLGSAKETFFPGAFSADDGESDVVSLILNAAMAGFVASLFESFLGACGVRTTGVTLAARVRCSDGLASFEVGSSGPMASSSSYS